MAAKNVPDRNWTPKEILRLDRMRADGLMVKECAAALGRSLNSVRGCLQRERIIGSGRMMRWAELIHAGATDVEAATAMGVEVRTVRRARSRLRKCGYELMDLRATRYTRAT